MDVVLLSRVQFAVTTYFHFLFVPLTLGLSLIIAIIETIYIKTGDEDYPAMEPFWDGNEVWLVTVGGVVGLLGVHHRCGRLRGGGVLSLDAPLQPG